MLLKSSLKSIEILSRKSLELKLADFLEGTNSYKMLIYFSHSVGYQSSGEHSIFYHTAKEIQKINTKR